MIKINGLVKKYGDKTILNIPELEFEKGKVYTIFGPNGAGKTTLLKILNLIEVPDKGELFLHGDKVKFLNKENFRIRRKMSFVSQPPFFFSASTYHNLTYGLKLRKVERKSWNAYVRFGLLRVGLEDYENTYPHQLSSGERQRLGLARALILEPELLLLDEPTANADNRSREVVEGLIKTLSMEFGMTVIMTTHDVQQAYRISDDIISLISGHVADTKPENIFKGEVERGDRVKRIVVNESVKVAAVTERLGKVYFSINPEDIIISYKPLESSALNSFNGKISKVIFEGDLARVFIDVGVEFVSVVTKRSFYDMHLDTGTSIWITFKTSSVKIF